MSKHFELTSETIEYEGTTLYRIRALKDFGDAKAGQLGDFVEKDLSQDDCWMMTKAEYFSALSHKE